ncbi:hypothetical protein K488DRAFT_72253 [Vararia minispora EC-137]|uniref:Uncharacterized protein n=1 Tax=Vararia minispora EC-137 TaxID=1314806 RepID=A0ACB8QF80_9AGAM|nr:hypothetical protein K488DRAFT_72253 [Vararia minispora EC-137]
MCHATREGGVKKRGATLGSVRERLCAGGPWQSGSSISNTRGCTVPSTSAAIRPSQTNKKSKVVRRHIFRRRPLAHLQLRPDANWLHLEGDPVARWWLSESNVSESYDTPRARRFNLRVKIELSFSNVYRARWCGHVVVVNIPARMAPKATRANEMGMWKALGWATGESPRFCLSRAAVDPYYKDGSLVTYLMLSPSMPVPRFLSISHSGALERLGRLRHLTTLDLDGPDHHHITVCLERGAHER